MVLSVAVYGDSIVVSGDEIATLINQNKDTFSVAVSDAVVGKLHMYADNYLTPYRFKQSDHIMYAFCAKLRNYCLKLAHTANYL